MGKRMLNTNAKQVLRTIDESYGTLQFHEMESFSNQDISTSEN